MNTANIATVQRLQKAGLFQVAERAAKRVELRLGDCIAPGEVTGGHRALWAELVKHQTLAQVAELVGFPEAAVRVELREVLPAPVVIPEPRPTPPPKSGPRVKKAVESPTRPAKQLPLLPIDTAPTGAQKLKAVEQRVALFEKRLRNMARIGERARQLGHDLRCSRAEVAALRTEVAKLKATVDALSPSAIQDSAEREAQYHLGRFGAAADVVRAEALARGIRVHEILSNKPARGRPGALVLAARKAIIVTLTIDARFRWSQPQIAAVLRKNPSTIFHWQRELKVGAAHLPGLKGEPRKAAA